MTQPALIDVNALARNRRRASRLGVDNIDFLEAFVADDLALRLSTISRTFDVAVNFNPPGDAVSRMLASCSSVETLWKSRSEIDPVFDADMILRDDLPALAAHSVSLLVSALNLHFVNDLPGTLIQIRRALKPDGLFLGALIGGTSLTELRQCLLEAEATVTGNAQARILPFIDVREAGGLLQRAGFALPVTDTDTLTVRYDNALALMRDLRAMGAANPLNGRARTFMRRDVLMKACALYQDRFCDADGRIRATFEIISLSGWAPHESQQKPLKPGSAITRLADVLGKEKSG